MGRRLDQFLAGSPKSLQLSFLGFTIAAVGVIFGFGLNYYDYYQPGNLLVYIAFGITVVGIVTGFVGIAWGWYNLFRRTK